MPKSRGRKKRLQKRPARPTDPHKLHLRSISFGSENFALRKEAMLESARKKVDEFPDLVERLYAILRDVTPEGVVTTFAFYGSQAMLSDEGGIKRLKSDVEQHHIELLQALALTLPLSEWGQGPVTGDTMQSVFDLLPEIAETFFFTRLIARDAEPDLGKQEVMELQEMIRMHTQAVRNWGYYADVLRISRDIYAPLSSKFIAAIGFSPNDLIDIGEHLVAEVERRASAHFDILRKVIAGKTGPDRIRIYYDHMPGISGDPEDLVKLFAGASKDGVMSALMSHSDLRHLDHMTFEPGKVAAATGKSEDVAEKVLAALSIWPDELVGTKVEHLFLGNPAWTRPGINLAGKYIFPIPQAIFSHINEIVRRIANEAKLDVVLSDRRSEYLEQRTAELLGAALPSAKVMTGVKWRLGDQQFETDVLAIIDRTAVIAEAKSHRVTPEGLRGAPDRLRRHLTDLVIEPSIQSERLASLISRHGSKIPGAAEVAQQLGIEPHEIDQVIRLSVTLDDLSVLSSSEDDLRKVGWIPEAHELAPSMHIADLGCIIDILDDEIHVVHYLAERFHVQKQFELRGDELDFLGLYLSTGFNLGPKNQEMKRLIISGMSAPIDRYYEARQAGLTGARPTIAISIFYKKALDRLHDRKSAGWLTAALHLLNSANRDEQKKVAHALGKLRKTVKRLGGRDDHKCFMLIVPPLDRKARVGFFLHEDLPKLEKRRRMERFGLDALESEAAKVCVVFGKSITDWDQPYESVLLLYDEGDTEGAENGERP